MDFVKSREDFITQFLSHLGTSAMMDLLLQMVAAPENDRNRIELAEVSLSMHLHVPMYICLLIWQFLYLLSLISLPLL